MRDGSEAVHVIVVFEVEDQRIGLPLAAVERVIPIVAITRIPDAAAAIRGVVRVGARVRPVLDVRRLLGLPDRTTRLSDHLVLAHSSTRSVALHVDASRGIESVSQADWVDAVGVLQPADRIAGFVKCRDGLVVVHDLDSFSTSGELAALDDRIAVMEADA